ncbi:MAG: spore coat protein CotJB [Lachnospiraceae bacterium]|nr:spore coat protein CotJB [Lachnospiraceae bacterium]MCD8098329.1 spore coat protein CotJB [Lachnospiraceae bacterium]
MAQNSKPSRKQMLDWVDMVSFAVVESNLYLDTHPEDPAALAYFEENKMLREQALKDYAALYGPLNIDCATGMDGKWDWVEQPWPWEGGVC